MSQKTKEKIKQKINNFLRKKSFSFKIVNYLLINEHYIIETFL